MSRKKGATKERLTVYLNPGFVEVIQKDAESNYRTANQQIAFILEEYYRAQGPVKVLEQHEQLKGGEKQ